MAPSHDEDHQEEETPAPAPAHQEEEETPAPAGHQEEEEETPAAMGDDQEEETPPALGHQEEETPAPGHQEEESQPPATTPAGYRFFLTDCELIRACLQKKVKNEAFPLSDYFKETSLRLKSPEALAAELPALGENNWYFFTVWGERADRAADSGYWKASGSHSLVICEERLVGFKQSFVFYPTEEERSEWIMHEYTLNYTLPKKTIIDWVICRLHKTDDDTLAFASDLCFCSNYGKNIH